MARSGLGESGTKPQQSSPPATVAADRRSRSLSVRGGERAGADEVAMVRRSSIAPCVSCGLCGGPLRDATTASECLHSFCRQCIAEKFKDEDKKCCPMCNIDLGCDPKLRADRSLQCISSVLFPAKRLKMEECSSLHPELVLLPQVASQRESQKNTAKMLESVEVYSGGTQALEAEKVRSREEFENERAQRAAACERTKIVEERFEREFETSQQSTMAADAAGVWEELDALISERDIAREENLPLHGELDEALAAGVVARRRDLEATRRQDSACFADLQQQLEKKMGHCQRLELDLADLQQQLEKKMEHCQRLELDLQAHAEERDALRRERDIARAEAQRLRGERDITREENLRLCGERDEALAAGAVARRDLEATMCDQGELEDQCKALQDCVCYLQNQLEKEMGHRQRLELDLQTQAEELEKEMRHRQRLKLDLQAHAEELDKKTGHCQRLESDLVDLQQQLEEESGHRERLESDLQAQAKEHRHQLNKETEHRQRLESDLQAQAKEHQQQLDKETEHRQRLESDLQADAEEYEKLLSVCMLVCESLLGVDEMVEHLSKVPRVKGVVANGSLLGSITRSR